MRSPAKAKGKALTPEAPTPATVPFMLARLDIQKEQLESDPKAQRISVDGQSRLREDFQRLQEGQIQVKVVNGDVEEPPEPPVTGSIDWGMC